MAYVYIPTLDELRAEYLKLFPQMYTFGPYSTSTGYIQINNTNSSAYTSTTTCVTYQMIVDTYRGDIK